MGKIQNKIIVMFLLVTIVPLLIVSVYFSLRVTKVLKQNKIIEFQRNTKIKAERTTHIFNSIEKDIRNLAVNVSLVNFIDASTEADSEFVKECKHRLELILKGFSEKAGIYDKIYYISGSGVVTVQVDLLSKGNSTVVPSNKLPDLRNRTDFNEVLKLEEGDVYVSGPGLTKEDEKSNPEVMPLLKYATPVFDRKMNKRGVLAFNVSMSFLLENISGFNSIKNVESKLLDRNGNYLLNTFGPKRTYGTSSSNPLSNINSALAKDVVDIVLSGDSGIKMVDNILLSFIPIKYDSLDSEKYWIYLETLDSSVVYSKIFTIYKIVGSLALLLMIGIVTTTLIFSKKVTQPLKELVKGATAVAKGDLDYHIDAESNDELTFVIFSFNKMVSNLAKTRKQLQNYANNLEEKISEKTMIINEKLKKSEVLVEAGQLLCQQKEINESMGLIVDSITKTLNINFCAILQLDKSDNSLHMVSGAGWKEGVVGDETIGFGLDPQMSCNLNKLGPVIINNLNSGSYLAESKLLEEHGIVSCVSVPMVVCEHVIGVLGVYSNEFREFTSDDINFLQSVGHIIAATLERAAMQIKT